jgi:hypothetical protein
MLFGAAGSHVALVWFGFFAIFNFFVQRGQPQEVARRALRRQQRAEARRSVSSKTVDSPMTARYGPDDDWGWSGSTATAASESDEDQEFNQLAEVKFCGQCGASFDNETDQYCGGCGCPRWLNY